MKRKKEHIALYSMLGLVGLLSAAYFFVNQMVSADTANNSKTISIPTGFTAYDVETINSIGLDKIKSNNLTLFSYNDAKTNFKNWSVYGPDCTTFTNTDKAKCFDTIQLTADTSYYVRNLKPEIKLLATSNPAKATTATTLASGWHLASWSGEGVRQSDFLKRLSLKDTSNQLQTLDNSIDKNLISTYIFEISKNNNKIVHKQLASIDSSTTTSKIKSKDSLWVYIFPSDQKFTSFAQTSSSLLNKEFSFGLNKGPSEFGLATRNNIDINSDIANLGANTIRYINFDLYVSTRSDDLHKAKEMKQAGAKIMGNFLPFGNSLPPDRNGTLLSSKGSKYTSAKQIIDDIDLYSGVSPDGTSANPPAQWDKLKALLTEEYFKMIVIPRINLYKDTIKSWQPWNEPDGKIGSTSWGITPEALSLLTTGQVKTSSGVVSFGNSQITGLDGKKYSLEKGVYGLVKSICPDCQVVSAGFYRYAPSFFEKLRDNNYMNYVDANEIHLNLHPNYSMGYTRYWSSTDSALRIYDILCAGRNNCNKPLYSTEAGSPGGAKMIETINNKATGFTMSYSENFQADDLIKRFVSLPAQGISTIDWNGYFDSHSTLYNGRTCPAQPNKNGLYEFTSPNSLCAHPLKGLYSQNTSGGYTKKPSYTAYQVTTSMLGYAKKVEILKKGNDERTDVDPVMLFKITDSDGKQKYAGWCEPFWNVTTPEKKAWNYEDRKCSKQIDLSEYGVKGTIVTTDRAGKTKEVKANAVTLTQSPVFIELR